jgi:phosphoglycerate kinase
MKKKYKTLIDLPDCHGKKVILRLDLNVPVQNGKVVDDFRIKKSLPTIDLLRDRGARIVILSHIEGGSDTLRPVFEYFKSGLESGLLKKNYPMSFCEDCLENGPAVAGDLKDGEMIMFENLRLYDGEKKNDPDFSKKLADFGEIYVNDAFSVSHRAHASIVGIPKFLPGYVGLQFEKEIENLSKCFKPPRPFLFILGGAKFDTKLPLVKKFLKIADTVFVGGALANDFYKAKGFGVGKSLLSDTPIDFDRLLDDPKIILPEDVVVTSTDEITASHKVATNNKTTINNSEAADENEMPKKITKSSDIGANETVRDDGPATLEKLKGLIAGTRGILWNGPLGNYENGFTEGTDELAKMIASAGGHHENSGGNSFQPGQTFSIVGGGDTLAAIAHLGIEDEFGFVSTGGGAMLDFLANETLPGLLALEK